MLCLTKTIEILENDSLNELIEKIFLEKKLEVTYY